MFLRKAQSDRTDEELLRLYKATRNLEWLGELYLRYASLVYGVCLKYLRDREEAQDAVMQIHEKLVESLLRHEVANFRSWLYVNARNHCLMHLRSKKTWETEEITLLVMENGAGSHPEEEISTEQNIMRLERCIETLSGEQKECVRLFYLKEKCYKEITEATGFDLKQVKSYIQNGKRNLKICMEKHAD